MPKALTMLDELASLANADALTYLVDLTVEPVERKVKLSTLAAFVQRYARQVILVPGSTAQTLDTTDIPTALVLVTGTVPSVVIGGTPLLNSEFMLVNGTAAPIDITSSTGFIGLPTTATSPITLAPGDALRVTRAESTPADVWVGEFYLGKSSIDASRTIIESVAGPDPDAIWATSGLIKGVRTITLPAGTWLVDAHTLFRAQAGGTFMHASSYWAGEDSPARYGAGHWNLGGSLLLGVPVPVRRFDLATETTLSLQGTVDYAGGTGEPVAWATITARRVF